MTWSDEDLSRLVEAMRQTGTTALEIEGEECFLRLGVSSAGTAIVAQPPLPIAAKTTVKSPGLGHFLPCGDGDSLEPITIGTQIQAGQVLGYIATGDLRVPVSAPVAGRLAACLATSGQITGYGDPLFSIEELQ